MTKTKLHSHKKIKSPILREFKKEHERRGSHGSTWYRSCCITLPVFLRWLRDEKRKVYKAASQQDIQEFVDYLLDEYVSPYGKKLSRRSINFYLSDIKTFYSWLKKSGKMKYHPAKDIKRLKVKNPDNQFKFLKPSEALEMINWVEKNSRTPKKDIAIIGLMFDPWGKSGGMRMGEVLGLDLDPKDINFEDQTIHITKTMGRFKIEDETKTHEPRAIVMTNKLKEVLLDYIENEREDPKEGNPLFMGPRTKKRLNKTNVNQMFKRIERDSGLTFRCKLRSHVGRHSAITKVINDPECSYQYVKRLSGIESDNILKGYTHHISDEDKRIAEGTPITVQPQQQDQNNGNNVLKILELAKNNNLTKAEKAQIIAEWL